MKKTTSLLLNYQNQLTELWQNKVCLSTVYERDNKITHGLNCKCCTGYRLSVRQQYLQEDNNKKGLLKQT